MSIGGEYRRRVEEIAAALQAAHPGAVKHAADVLQEAIRHTLSQPGRGRLYKSRGVTSRLARKGTKKRTLQLHQASAPGDPPAVDIGFLRASVVLNPRSDGTVKVGPAAQYAAALEYGTQKGNGRIAPRPFMQRSLDAAAPAMKDVIVEDLRAAVATVAGSAGR